MASRAGNMHAHVYQYCDNLLSYHSQYLIITQTIIALAQYDNYCGLLGIFYDSRGGRFETL